MNNSPIYPNFKKFITYLTEKNAIDINFLRKNQRFSLQFYFAFNSQ